MSLKKFLKEVFGRYTPMDLQLQELREAQMSLLKAQTGFDWAKSQVAYNQQRVSRLTGSLVTCALEAEVLDHHKAEASKLRGV